MKKIMFVIAIVLAGISGCEYIEDYCELWYSRKPCQSEIVVGKMGSYSFKNDLDINSIDSAFSYVHDNIKYVADINDYWQLPEETYTLKQGDCEDLAILFLYLCKEKFDTELSLVNIINGDNSHILVYDQNTKLYYEIKNYFIETKISEGWRVNWICPYSEAIWMTYYYHNNVGQYY